MAADLKRVQAVFLAAAEEASAVARATVLDCECGDDAELRQQVEALLKAHDAPGSFLDRPAFDPDDTEEEGLPGAGATAATAAAGAAGADLPAAPSEQAGAVVGNYKLLQQIGEGGMGVVYLAEQTRPVQRKVAIKIIKPGMDSRQVSARFEAERQALAMMDHVNIARVFDGGATATGRPYFVMELVHGVPITKYCDDNHLAPRERLELFIPVCQAIQHAHQKGIIHRDIKPSNIMITLYDGRPVPKVIDFGVAKATEQRLTEQTLFTQFGAMVGTLEYMSPEQAELSALGVDTRSDIYSLGVVLYELLTGNTPLTRKRMKDAAYAEILRMIKEDEPPRPSTRLSDSGEALAWISANRDTEPAKLTRLLRGELDWIVMKTLEKDRSRRYETANGFAQDLQRYLADEPVQACTPSVGYRFGKFVRRNRRSVVAAGLVFVALLAGVAGATLGMIRARQAQEESQQARERIERERDAAVEARKETFDALIDLTDYANHHLLFDGRAATAAEREFLQRLDTLYGRLGTALLGAEQARDKRVRSLSHAGQAGHVGRTDPDSHGDVRGLDAWLRAAQAYPGIPPVLSGADAEARIARRNYARRCRAVALTAEKLRRWPEAIDFCRRQLRFAQAALVPGERPDTELFNLLLTGNWCLTLSLSAAGRIDEAIDPWQDMVRLVAWSEPGGVNNSACAHLSRIAAELTAARQAADPLAVLASGLAERRARLTNDPALPQTRMELRRGYRVLGLIHEKSRKFPEALDAFEKVIALGTAPVAGAGAQGKEATHEQSLVFGALLGRAICLDALRPDDAEAAWKALYGWTKTDAANWFVVRAIHLARNGQPERAVRMAEDSILWPESEPRGGVQPYDAACVFATASADAVLSSNRKDEMADRAVALLGQAKVDGFFDDPKHVAHAKVDADLDPIRARADMRRLMTTLEADTRKRTK